MLFGRLSRPCQQLSSINKATTNSIWRLVSHLQRNIQKKKEVKGMSKIYIVPEMEVVECERVAVITTSGKEGLTVETSGNGDTGKFGDLFS